MYKISESTFETVHKPFDFVESKNGSIGFITLVNVNSSQKEFKDQVSYAVNWIKGSEKSAWWNHDELNVIGNMFKEIAKSVNSSIWNSIVVDKIM